MNPRILEGKVTLVTGAGGGIGRATAIVLGQAGAKVMVSDVSTAAARAQRWCAPAAPKPSFAKPMYRESATMKALVSGGRKMGPAPIAP